MAHTGMNQGYTQSKHCRIDTLNQLKWWVLQFINFFTYLSESLT